MVVTKAERGIVRRSSLSSFTDRPRTTASPVADALPLSCATQLVNKDTLLAQYSSQIASLRSQIASLESGPSASSSAAAAAAPDAALLSRLGLAEERASSAAQAVAEKDAELERLRALLDKTRSLVLTGPELERSARRVSGAALGAGAGAGAAAGGWDELLSPSRSRSLRLGTPGQRCAGDGMGALGLGRPGGTGARDLRASVGGRLAEEDEGREKVRPCSHSLISVPDTERLANGAVLPPHAGGRAHRPARRRSGLPSRPHLLVRLVRRRPRLAPRPARARRIGRRDLPRTRRRPRGERRELAERARRPAARARRAARGGRSGARAVRRGAGGEGQ